MIKQTFLFLVFLLLSSSVYAIEQKDIITIQELNYLQNDNVMVSPVSISQDRLSIKNIDDTKILDDSIIEKSNGVIFGTYTTVEVSDSNIDLNNVGVGKGIVAIAGDNISGNIQVSFYTNMPDTPFSIKHYAGITDNKTLVQEEGEIIIPLIYSDEYGTVTYNSSNFSTQILSFPDPLVHASGGSYTNYYLDYFFSSYDFVTLTQSGVFLINDSWSNYSQYENNAPTNDYISYDDSLIEVYFYGATKRLTLRSNNYANGFTKSVTIKAANNPSHAGEVSQTFTWKLNATANIINQYPIQKGYIPNQSITKNNRKTFFFNDYYSNYTDVCVVVFNASNYSQVGMGFDQSICVNTTLYQYGGILNSSVFLIDLNGVGNDINMAFYSNNTQNVTLDIWYTAGKRNSTGNLNLLNISNFYLTISGDYPSTSLTNFYDVHGKTINIVYTSGSGYETLYNNHTSNISITGLSLFTGTGWTSGYIYNTLQSGSPCPSSSYSCGVSGSTCMFSTPYNVTNKTKFYTCTDKGGGLYNSAYEAYANVTGNTSKIIYVTGGFVTTPEAGLLANIGGVFFTTKGFSSPVKTSSLPNINIYTDEMVYFDYNDYFTGFDRIYINFTAQNGTNISMYSLFNATSYKFVDNNYYILNISGNGYTERLYITVKLNSSTTLFNISICNNNMCIYELQYLNISVAPITDVPLQINHIDNIFMQLNDTHTENWGGYFTGYTGLIISFVDLITGNNVTIFSENVTGNFTTSYLNITTFKNGLNHNTTFQSYNTQYYTVMLIEAINAYGSAYQYVNFNINYTAPVPDVPFVETCITVNVICLFIDYTKLTQSQMNWYMIGTLIFTFIIFLIIYMNLGIDMSWLLIFVTIIAAILEAIYFVYIKYMPIEYVVWGVLILLAIGFILYRRLSRG